MIRKYLTLEDVKTLLNMKWEDLDKEIDNLDKEDLKSIIAYSSGYYQANNRR